MDWGSARNSRDGLPPQRERSNRTPRKQEPEFDWNTARNTQAELPVREKEKDHKEKTLMELQEKTLLDKHQESKNQNLIGVLPETLKPVYHQEKDLIELVPTVVKIN